MESSTDYLRIEKAIKFIKDNYLAQPSLEEVAEHVNLSKFHFQKMFQDWAGISPKSFVQYLTVQHAKKLLIKGQSTLLTSLDVGLSGTGRLHDLFVKIESVRPGQYKEQGDKMIIKYSFCSSPFGEVIIAETEYGICNLSFIADRKMALSELQLNWPNARLMEEKSIHTSILNSFFNQGEIPLKKISIDLKGTTFQLKVWEALLKIPFGQLVSYADIALMIDKPKAMRAVGTAIGKNPIAFLIPCHRVIRQAGEIGEYRWGGARKSVIIGWESAKDQK